MKILKILSFYHVCFRNYDHLKYGPFNLYTEPLKFLSFWNCVYSVIFNMKHLKFALIIHFYKIIPKTMCLAQNFIKHVCGGELKLSKLLLQCFSFHFQIAISWKDKIKCARTNGGNTLPGILQVKTSFMHILAYLVELGAAKVGCSPKNGILGQLAS